MWNRVPEWIADILKQAAGVLLAISPLLNSGIRDLVVKKFQLSFDKALENRKAINDRKNYISKTRFDKEFETYQVLSEKQISLVYDCGESVIRARGNYENGEECEGFFEQFSVHLNDADIWLKRYAPFISKQIFEKYRTLDRKATQLLKLSFVRFQARNMVGNFNFNGQQYTRESSLKVIETMQKEISILSDDIIEYVREYLNSLDVMNG